MASASASSSVDMASPRRPDFEYGHAQVHADLEAGKYCGRYGADHTAYHALATMKAGVDMNAAQTGMKEHEKLVPELDALLSHPRTRAAWAGIASIDPMGMYASRPTIAATYAKMTIPELQAQLAAGEAEEAKSASAGVAGAAAADSKVSWGPSSRIVDPDGQINCIKMSVDMAWNLPAMSKLLGYPEADMRTALAEYTGQDNVRDASLKTYLPPVGGTTVYFIGDPSKLTDPATEVAVRCHDACCGSDCFGTDICTCRPYLVYAIQGAVETAKRGGVGVIAYFRKEGRALGEVIKFRVYNTRKAQPGGDTPEMYFKVTESIAGIRDARVQEIMPDILLLCGVTRIDWLLSMSSDKYDAITGAGIEVMQRVPLPSSYVPAGAAVEITAKIAAGYHAESIASDTLLQDLRTLESIRDRCGRVLALALKGKSKHFDVDLAKLPALVDFVADVTKRNYGGDLAAIPYHSRMRHLDMGEVEAIAAKWPVDPIEKTRRIIDLVTVSVLLDAGAGPAWSFVDADGKRTARSEGLAAASQAMFFDGAFSSDAALPHRVNSLGLKTLSLKALEKGFQVSHHNPMVGVDGRHGILQRLGAALEAHPEFFGTECPRPGNVVDYVLKHAKPGSSAAAVAAASAVGGAGASATAAVAAGSTVSIRVLWKAVIEGLESIWPSNASVRRGDVWVYSPLKVIGVALSDLVPFHKLSQWLTYSLLEPLESLGVTFGDMDLMTGLAEYRNGGLFVDGGVLVPKDRDRELIATRAIEFDIGTELVVEWRALTIVLLDKLAEGLRAKLGLTAEQLPLAKVLQGGTWAAGREIAKSKRADGSSPIPLRSDGTVF